MKKPTVVFELKRLNALSYFVPSESVIIYYEKSIDTPYYNEFETFLSQLLDYIEEA